MTRVALVVPLTTDILEREDSSISLEYLGHSYIASYLRINNIEVYIIDSFLEKLSSEQVCKKLSENTYDFVFFTIMSQDYLEMTKIILSKLASINFKVVIGGRHISNQDESLFKEIERLDYILDGEGEYSSLELVKGNDLSDIHGLIWKDENGNIIRNRKRELLSEIELDQLPFPSRDTLKHVIKNKYLKQASVLASRGCQGNCYFCGVASYNNHQIGKRWKGRSPQNVVREIKELVNEYGINYIYFTDDDFIGPGYENQKRAQEFARLLIKEKLNIKYTIFTRADVVEYDTFKLLKESGVNNIFIGVEFGVDRILKFYNKGINKEQIKHSLKVLEDLELKSSIGYIMFEPTMTIDELKENLEFYFENVDFRLKMLLVQLAIYDNCEAYTHVKDIIDVDEYTTNHYLFGDIHSYRFKDKKVEIVFKILNESVYSISPSNYLQKVRKLKLNEKDYNDYCKIWSDGLLKIIINLINKIKSKEFTCEEIEFLSSDFKSSLLNWDMSL